MTEEVDVDPMTKVSKLKVELLDHESSHIRIQFAFSAESDYFSNMNLEVESKMDLETK